MKKLRILIVGEGTPNFWAQFAIGFHRNNHNISYASLQEGLIDYLILHELYFDLIITNQLGIHAFAIAVRDNKNVIWEKNFKHFLMIQFHDIGRELPTLLQSKQIFSQNSILITYLTYCTKSHDLLNSLGIFNDFIFSYAPISFDCDLNIPKNASADFVSDISKSIVPHVPPGPVGGTLAFFPKLIYIGGYFFNKEIYLRQDGSLHDFQSFQNAITEYHSRNNPMERLGFVKGMYDNGEISDNNFMTGVAGEYLYNYCCLIILPIRHKYVKFLKNIYGGDFHLYSKEWKNFGLDSISLENAADNSKYESAFISVDFGSTYLDTSIYQRTMQIFGSGGRLLQLRQADSHEIFGPFADHVCFDTPQELQEKIDAALSSPIKFLDRQRDLAEYMENRYNSKIVCSDILQKLGLNPQ